MGVPRRVEHVPQLGRPDRRSSLGVRETVLADPFGPVVGHRVAAVKGGEELRDRPCDVATSPQEQVRAGGDVSIATSDTPSAEAREPPFLPRRQVEVGEIALALFERVSRELLDPLLEGGSADSPFELPSERMIIDAPILPGVEPWTRTTVARTNG